MRNAAHRTLQSRRAKRFLRNRMPLLPLPHTANPKKALPVGFQMPSVKESLEKIREKISLAPHPQKAKILAASKSQPIEKIQEAAAAGVKLFGENYLQEAEKKISQEPNLEWHFIGHLQTNKAKKAVELFKCIQTVDSLKLAKKINDASPKPFPVFLELNIASEKNKFGIKPEKLEPFFANLKQFQNLEVKGLFCMAPFMPKEQTRPFFQKMRSLSQTLSLKELSMGMSNDYTIAIEEGATMVRIGTALFGEREK